MSRKVIVFLVFVTMILVSTGFAQVPNLKINEFLASNDFGNVDPFGGNDDWLEIYNAGDVPVDIGNMYITDNLADPTAWQIPATFPDSTTIQPGGFLILWADKETYQGVLHVDIKLSGDGEEIGLFMADGTTAIDQVVFGAQAPDTSMGRFPDGSDNWVVFTNPTPEHTNRYIPVIVNEFLASNDTYIEDPEEDANDGDPYDDCIELFNAGIKPVDIGGMYITDDLADPMTWQIPDTEPGTTTIEPGAYLVIWADKETQQGVLHVDIKLSGDGEQIGLFGADGSTVIDTLTFGPQTTDVSYGRVVDGMNMWDYFSTPSVGTTNSEGVVLGIEDQDLPVLNSFELWQNYPNPFNPVTTISYSLKKSQFVILSVYNVLGEKIVTLYEGMGSAGLNEVRWDASDFSSGLYFYSVSTGSQTLTRKMLLVK